MAVKMTGAEYKRFMTDETLWGEDGYFDDAFLSVDGKEEVDVIDIEILADTSAIQIKGGYVFDLPGGREMTLDGLFRKWKRLQDTDTFLVTCPKALTETIKSLIKNNGGQAV